MREPPFHQVSQDTTSREDALVILASLWTIAGLFLDGYAHENFRDLESFWTPWHGVFYSGFTATAIVVVWIVERRRVRGRSWSASVPDGYRLGVLGLVVFAIGGVGDAVWHTVFGVEATIDALLSPTHVVLFAGLLLVLTSPVRKRSALADPRPEWRNFAVPMTSVVLSVSLVAFFFVYLWGPGVTWVFRESFDPLTEEGEIAVMAGMGAAMVSTAIMVWPVMWLGRRVRPPFGAVTLLLVAVNVLVVAAFDRDPAAIGAALAGGLVADILFRFLPQSRGRLFAVGVCLPLTLWSTLFWLQLAGPGVEWQPELWGGVIVFSALEGLALAELALGAGNAPGEEAHTVALRREPALRAAEAGDPQVGL